MDIGWRTPHSDRRCGTCLLSNGREWCSASTRRRHFTRRMLENWWQREHWMGNQGPQRAQVRPSSHRKQKMTLTGGLCDRFQRTSILQQTGFLNREELHSADIAAIEENPNKANVGFFKLGRWIWAHNAELYARENYDGCLASLQEGRPFPNTNIPPGHVYQPWSLESERERMEAGIPSNLKQNGYWGIEERP